MLNILFAGMATMFVLMALGGLIQLRWVRRLPQLPSESVVPEAPPAFCSVVLAARNEEARVENTIRHLLGQTGVILEIIVVNDRSSDGTAGILERLAAEDSRVRVVSVETLPADWLGKCHACHTGAKLARGEWILFADADCWLAPNVIARSISIAQLEKADHVTLAPSLAVEGLAPRAWYLMFLTSVAGWISGVNRDRPKAHLGIGAFNLVRPSAYQRCGGYEALRLTVVDDVKLGLLLSRAKCRTRAYLAGKDLECHWGTRVADFVRVLEKNYFAVLNYRLSLVVAGSVFGLGVFGTIAAGLILHTPLGIAAAFSPFALVFPAAVLAHRINWPRHVALLVPFMMPLFLYGIWRSTYVTLRHGGVRWRETFYPLAQLRAGGVQ